jgi:hypothetical protein
MQSFYSHMEISTENEALKGKRNKASTQTTAVRASDGSNVLFEGKTNILRF